MSRNIQRTRKAPFNTDLVIKYELIQRQIEGTKKICVDEYKNTSTRHFLIPSYHIIKTETSVVNNLSSDAKKTLLDSHSLDIVPIMTLQLILEPNVRKGYRFIFFHITNNAN